MTIVVPSWKRVQKLKACLESLRMQTRKPDQVIVVIRTEDRETVDYLTGLSGEMTSLRVLETRAPGVINAENVAIREIKRQARESVITFMDDDAIAYPDWVKNIETFLGTHPQAAALGGPDIIVSEPWTYHDVLVSRVGLVSFFGRVTGNHHHRSQGLRQVHVLKGVNMSVRSSFLEELDESLQGTDPAKGNGVFWELDLCLRIRKKGGAIFFDPDLLIQHDSDHKHFIPLAVISSTSHNLTRVMKKHLPSWRFALFVVYSFFIGNGNIKGILKTTLECLRRKNITPFQEWQSSMRGFWAGLNQE